MITESYSLDDFYHEIYFESNDRFEEVRQLCLSENNWLGRNFEKDRLIIENHKGFGVVYHKQTHEPVVFGGVFNDGRFPKKVARHMHRFYAFPNWRGVTKSQIVDGWTLTDVHLVQPLNKINDFDVYFMSMQIRDKKVSRGYFKVWNETLRQSNSNWQKHDNLIQTCPYNVQKCWQNFVYMEMKENAFNEWNPKTLTQDEWLTLEVGTD